MCPAAANSRHSGVLTGSPCCLRPARVPGEVRPAAREEFFRKNSYTRKDAGFPALARPVVRSPSRLAMHKLSPACWSIPVLDPSLSGDRGSYGGA